MTSTETTKKKGRPNRGAKRRIELRRPQASTTLRIHDRNLALLHKFAAAREIPLSEALEQLIDQGAEHFKVKVRANKTAALGWA